jgi:hypothetical protein
VVSDPVMETPARRFTAQEFHVRASVIEEKV